MFKGLTKPKFYVKCKSGLKMTKTRLEGIRKKKNSVQRYLKNDIADLIRNDLHYNAYGRADGLLIEQNMTSCYDDVDKFCECIYPQLSTMQKQSQCPDECKEAVQSLIYAAARFADLPELRDLRSMFTEKYGSSVEPFVNKEFVEKLKGNPPTKEMKIQLMHNIANEFAIEWDSKALEQKLFIPPPPSENDQGKHSFPKYDNDDEGFTKRDDNKEESETGSSSVGSCSEEDNEVSTPSREKKIINDAAKEKTTQPRSVRRKNLKPPPGRENINYASVAKYEMPLCPARSASLPLESEYEPCLKPARASSLEPEMLGAGHVHPKLPDYDDLAARIAALNG
ncbi:hypothetical protein ACFE04_008429 [Oxalis oulophora]